MCSRELEPDPRIGLVADIGATYTSSQTTPIGVMAARIGNIDLIYEAVGQSRFVLEVLKVLGINGIFVLSGVPREQTLVEGDPARLMREMVLKNQLLLGSVNAGPEGFASALRSLQVFSVRWPSALRSLISGRYPPERAPELLVHRPTGIKSVIAF